MERHPEGNKENKMTTIDTTIRTNQRAANEDPQASLAERAEEMLLETRDPQAVADALGLELSADCEVRDGAAYDEDVGVALVLPGWVAGDAEGDVDYPNATSGEEAAQEYCAEGEWDERTVTGWVDVWAWRPGLLLVRCGEDGEDERPEWSVEHVVVGREQCTVTLEPEEPECTGEEHDWQSPVQLVGGCRSNPGVFGRGGGMCIDEVCVVCGCLRTTDTWAQRHDTGEQGLRSVRYDADDSSLRDYLGRLDADDLELDRVGESEDDEAGWSVSLGGQDIGPWVAVVVVDGDDTRIEWHDSIDKARVEAAAWVESLRETEERR